MSWYDFLKSIFPKLKSIVHIDFSKTNNVHISNTNIGNNCEYDDSTKRLTINLSKLSPEEEKNIQKLLTTALDENVVLLQDKSKAIIEDFKAVDKSAETQEFLNFLRPLIPSSDIIIWREALYLRKHFLAEQKDVPRLKMQICNRFGDRGKNIANLCTAGYLENYLVPAYNELLNATADEKKAKEKFLAIYSNIVEGLPFTVFVYHKMKGEEIEKIILDKVEQNLKYGLKFFNIHGIGKNNIKEIKKTVLTIEEKDILQNKNINEENNIISVRLEFK